MWFPLQLLSVTCWAAVNVLDSVVVHNHEKRPYVIQWHQSFFTLSVIALTALTQPVSSSWAPQLFVAGLFAYIGDWFFFVALNRIDTSVTNIAWGLQSIFLSIGGVLLFAEMWSPWQGIGVVLLLAGSALLSLRGKHLDARGFGLLVLLALCYTPFYLTQKAALVAGEPVIVAFFWPLFGREILAGSVPLLVPRWRKDVMAVLKTQKASFPLLNAAVVGLFFAGIYFTTRAFEVGPVSLVSVLGNVQAFIVLLFAWMLWKIAPLSAARELLTRQAVGVKIVSFLIVFIGLLFLTIH